MLKPYSLLALAGWGISVVAAADIVYVTDLPVFAALAPCAQWAVSRVIRTQTQGNCPEDVTALQSCICSKNNGGNRVSISNAISDSVDYSCGGTATDDQASASTVFSAYCDQNAVTSFPSPRFIVSQYIDDLPAFRNLAPCAAHGASRVVRGMAQNRCPSDPSGLATCACQKNQNSLWASEEISSSVKYDCDGHVEDISSAEAVFAGYCGLVEGTTSFPNTTDPPGDVTYYITALDQFKSLAPCAQNAVSRNVLSQTNSFCPSGPKGLASCLCLRNDMLGTVSAGITSAVRYSCDSTAVDDVSSALDVWNLYCDVAKGSTTPAGITESVSEPTPNQLDPTQFASPSSGGTDMPRETGTPGSDPSDGTTSGKTASNKATIVGAVVGVVVGITVLTTLAFVMYRRSRRADGADLSQTGASDNGKPPTPIIPKTTPVSILVTGPQTPPELHHENAYPRTAELHGQHAVIPRHEAFSQPVYEAHGQSRWQSAPHNVPSPQLYEMDVGNAGHRLAPPAR